MKRYIKNPASGHVFIPGVGHLKEGQQVMGDFAHLSSKFLTEVPEPPPRPAAPVAQVQAQQPLESRPPDRGPRLLVDQHNVRPMTLSEPVSEKPLDEQKPDNEEEKPAPRMRRPARPRSDD